VNPPYVIALPVFPYQGIVLTHYAYSVRSALTRAAPATDCSDRRQRHYSRGHHNFAGSDELPIKLHQTEGIHRPYGQRPGGEPAANPPQQRILHDAAPPQIRSVD
jgi:hypothetical protein